MTALNPKIDFTTRWDGGISDLTKNAEEIEYGFGRSINYRSDPYKITILPKTSKESGSVVTDLIKDGDRVSTDLYEYGDTGNIYKRTSGGSITLLRSVANSHGNGMKYYGEDDRLYYTGDKVIGRYGQIVNGTPEFVDDFLTAEGGIPLNTYWLDLEASSSQYADRADTASLSITGDLAIEAVVKPESLPAVGSSMVIFSKWDVNGNIRSYKFEIYAVSGFFGDGSDGALTISSNTTDTPIDSACTGTSGASTLSATNASFAVGQQILIHQTIGTGAGTVMRNKIAGYTAGTITLDTPLTATFSAGAQVIVMKQYTNVTVDAGDTWTAKAWNGTTGGIITFLASGTIAINGAISASSRGFAGGAGGASGGDTGVQGTSYTGTPSASGSANTTGGGGGDREPTNGAWSAGGAGAGGGHATNGLNGSWIGGANTGVCGTGGGTVGGATLSTLFFGGGGGGGGADDSAAGGAGGTGGGIVYAVGTTITMGAAGAITAVGAAGASGGTAGGGAAGGSGGSGAGGSILLKAQTATLGTGLITASGGAATDSNTYSRGGAGGDGRIHLDYLTSYTGSTTPTIDVAQDNNLVTTTTYQLRLGLSSNGTNEEFLTKNSTIAAGTTSHVGVSWDASDSTAEFFQEGVSLGSSSGALTAINNNASRPCIGADFNSTARNFYDGKIDEVRIWNTERTAAQMYAGKEAYIETTAAGLVAWYKLNNSYADAHANANDLSATNSPVFATDVAYSAATTRNDLDQELNTSGNTYTLATAINEGATHRQTFVPQKDPQKSIQVLVAAVGTGNWTLTVHDAANRIVATKTVANASMNAGDFEFTFDEVWRPVRGASYHFHLTSTVADGTVTTTTASDLETVDFHSYYQYLVEDTEYHQIEQILNVLGIGNERYLATYAADEGYNPHRLVFPSGWRVRCLTLWRDFIAIGCMRGDSVTSTDEGMIFFWDGKSQTYNGAVPIPEGAVNAMKSYKGRLAMVAGYHGEILFYEGGDSTNDDLKKRIPKLADDEYIEVMPKAMTVWDGLLRIGVAGTSDSETVERGIYTYGRKLAKSPTSLSYDFPISTGSRASSGVKVGFLYPIATNLVMGWKDATVYGEDVVNLSANPFATAEVVKDIKDFGRVSKAKAAQVVRAEFDPLNSGETIRLKYRFDREDDWTYGDVVSTAGTQEARLDIDLGEHRELEYGCDLTTSVSTSPALLELAVQEDLKPEEQRF